MTTGAAEHFVFCDESAVRQPVRTTAAEIVDAPAWYFWWTDSCLAAAGVRTRVKGGSACARKST